MTDMTDRKGLVERLLTVAEMHKSHTIFADLMREAAAAIAQQDTQQDGREAVAWPSREVLEQWRAAIVIACERDNMDKWRKVLMAFDSIIYSRASTPPSPELAVFKALVLDAIPSNWLDPLLSGPTKFANPPYSCHDIEALLRGIRERITAAIAAVEGGGK